MIPDGVGDLADDIATLVRVTDGAVDVHVIVDGSVPLRSTAAAVRTAVASAVPGTTVDVTVEDIDVDGGIGRVGGR